MLPTVGNDTTKILWYTAEVAGRALGVAAMPNLVPEASRRQALEASGNAVAAAVKQLGQAYVARLVYEFIDSRIAFGKGRGIDKGFDATVASASETIRTSLPDRLASNPDYREVFPNGTEEFTSPTIKEDEHLAADLRQAVDTSKLSVKGEVVATLDAILPIVGPAATAVRDCEKQVNALFQAELSARKLVVDTLWTERKNIEAALGRGGRGIARFIVFDFRSSGAEEANQEAAPAEPAQPAAPAKPDGAPAPAPK